MKRRRRYMTLIVHRDNELGSKSLRLPVWFVRTATVVGSVFLVFVVVAAILYTPVVRSAARVPSLTREVERLTAENQQVHELASTLSDVEARYAQLRAMLGADVIPEPPIAADSLPRTLAVLAQPADTRGCYELGASTPAHWPLDEPGVITRGPVGVGSSDEVHTGVDIAVPTGTPIRAAGGGVVTAAGQDAEYGLYVRIRHPEGYVSMYGHASRRLTATGDSVVAGQVIGLSGTTGRSTAPHLHFEISKDGTPVDPQSQVHQRCSKIRALAKGS